MSTFTTARSPRPRCVSAWRARVCATAVLGMAACSDLPLAPEVDTGLVVSPSFALVGTAFSDGFSGFDAARWGTSSHTLGRSALNPANVVIAGDSVRLQTTSNPYEGAEIWTRDLYGTGTFSVRGRCAVPAGALCAFFLYEGGVGDRADEVDIEILGGTRTIYFTTWVRGRRTNHRSATLPFAPDQAMHSYTIVRDVAEIRFLVDGAELARFAKKQRLPQARMPILANAWWPTWLTPAGGSGAWVIDQIAAY